MPGEDNQRLAFDFFSKHYESQEAFSKADQGALLTSSVRCSISSRAAMPRSFTRRASAAARPFASSDKRMAGLDD